MAKDTTANWQVVDIASLPSDLRASYQAYKDAYATMKAQRDVFEAALRSALHYDDPNADKRLAIAYNFGKLSVAVVANDQKAKPAKGSVSLADIVKR